MSGITLAKLNDVATEDVRDAGMNDGTGRLAFIGGLPAVKVNGAVIRMTGGVLRCITVETCPTSDLTIVTRYRTDGTVDRDGLWSRFSAVRTALIRWALANGTFAGIGRMR